MQLISVVTATLVAFSNLAAAAPTARQSSPNGSVTRFDTLPLPEDNQITDTDTSIQKRSDEAFSISASDLSSIPLPEDNIIDASATDAHLAKREPSNFRLVTYCADSGRHGACQSQYFRSNICYRTTAAWNDRISSMYPQRKTYCMVYDKTDCDGSGRNGMVGDTGMDNFKTIGMNDRVSSIKCEMY